MRLYLNSVPRTGTRFLRSLLEPDAYHHVWDDEVEAELERADVIVAPLRDPLKTWNTWRCYDKRSPAELLRHFEEDWRLLDGYARRFKIHLIPVDVEGLRDERLALLSDAIGRQIATDWAPVGSFPGLRPEPAEAPDLSAVYSLPILQAAYPGALSGSGVAGLDAA